MPQYPLPAWTEPYTDNRPRISRKYGPNNSRFRHVALFRVGADNSIGIVRANPDDAADIENPCYLIAHHDDYVLNGPFIEGWSQLGFAPRLPHEPVAGLFDKQPA